MNRNLWIVALLLIASFTFVGCGDSPAALDVEPPTEEEPQTEEPQTEEEPEEEPEEPEEEPDKEPEEPEEGPDKEPEEPSVADGIARDPYLFDNSNSMNLSTYYTDTFDSAKSNFSANFGDYDVVSSTSANQSAKMQAAIDDANSRGGGVLYLDAGSYCFRDVYIKSNVHIVIDSGATLYPVVNSTKVEMFRMDSRIGLCENTSIRCSDPNSYYTVRFDTFVPADVLVFVTLYANQNFRISDFKLYDCYTKLCAVNMGGVSEQVTGIPLRPTDGELSHCIIYDCHPGYGLVQTGAAERVYFEDLYSTGGVTLRIEIGGETIGCGAYDLAARNIRSEDGLCALLLGPHSLQNGVFKGDGFWAKGSACTVCWGKGGSRTGSDLVGSFASGSKVINIEGVAGRGHAFIKRQTVPYTDPDTYNDLDWFDKQIINGRKWLVGDSICVMSDSCYDSWTLEYDGVRSLGFDTDWVTVHDIDFGYPDGYNEFTIAKGLGFTDDTYYMAFPEPFVNSLGQVCND